MLPNEKKNIGIGAGFLALAGLAIAGWTRKPADLAINQNPVNGAPASFVQTLPAYSGGDIRPAAQSNSAAANYAPDGYYSSVQRPVSVHRAEYNTPAYESPVYGTADRNSFVETNAGGARQIYRSEPGRTTHYEQVQEPVHSGRSVKKSAAIVAGTAGVGAAIGAVAAGGKGAALGALSGGGAGFVYDRLTHNH